MRFRSHGGGVAVDQTRGRGPAGWPERLTAKGCGKTLAAVRPGRETSGGGLPRTSLPSGRLCGQEETRLSCLLGRAQQGSVESSAPARALRPNRGFERRLRPQVATRSHPALRLSVASSAGKPEPNCPAVRHGAATPAVRPRCIRRGVARGSRDCEQSGFSQFNFQKNQAKALAFRGLACGVRGCRYASPLPQRFPTLRRGTRLGNWRI